MVVNSDCSFCPLKPTIGYEKVTYLSRDIEGLRIATMAEERFGGRVYCCLFLI